MPRSAGFFAWTVVGGRSRLRRTPPTAEFSGVAIGYPSRDRSAYTLLELILALALSVLVVSAITAAISVYLINLNRQQRQIETKQIVRSVMLMIANDLRAGIQYKALDVSGIENLSASQSLIAGLLGGGGGAAPMGGGATGEDGGESGEGQGAGGGAEGGGADGANSGGETADSGDDSESSSSEDTGNYRPTFVGEATGVLIDVSRLPRLDQYHAMLVSADSTSQTGSDVKTISYFVSQAPAMNNTADAYDPAVASQGGLYRRQVDRAVAAYAGDDTLAYAPDQFSQLVAPEVIELQFRFFDGSSWQSSWNSEEMGSFPTAIEVVMIVDPNRSLNPSQRQTITVTDILNFETYRTVVHLPAAEAAEEEEE